MNKGTVAHEKDRHSADPRVHGPHPTPKKDG
eukprot:CAMPEP_0194764106 /NCGR_PEP_ID=MMETSP0323_2-20130528/21101_1 /TAXON_ID=2866 ORGANISM="Crypthecodinium cohnii, Strain Seligo" /NCGR_SAMPLE_ID=MMETSP0323_2 /ASSEMBLY_ACC=CAM_ASM_000346 /LENGTH=30 /DNA_ID= /DNA_START= /DNA_END= /DNA_ORIENTATION=